MPRELNTVEGENFHPDVARDADLDAHTGNTSNPHNVSKSQVGLANVENVSIQDHIDDTTNPHSVTKTQVGLGNVENVSIQTHINNVSNPHSVTADQLGAVIGSGQLDSLAVWLSVGEIGYYDTLVYDGSDLKVGDISGGNYFLVESDGTIQFLGDASVWDDIRIVPSAFDFAGASDPTLITWQPGGLGTTFRVWEFNVNDEVFFTIQLPHTYKLGSNLYPHIHWTPKDQGVIENGRTVAWTLDYSIADDGGVFGSSTTVDLTDTCNGVDHRHERSPSGVIDGSGIADISSILIGRLYRNAGDTWIDNSAAARPVLLEFDIHYEMDSTGSHEELVK